MIFRYDNHFIIQELAKQCKTSNIELLANTKEIYVRIKTPKFLFHDSYSHLNDSLDNLAKNLKDKGSEYFTFVRDEFPDDTKFTACLQKLVYPYTYMNSFEKFAEAIPDESKFHNDLTNEPIDDIEYKRLKYVCKIFNIQTLGELHDLYLKIDVLILASVFEFYRKMGLDEYGLDPAFYVSAPSFSFDAMLFKTKVELELIKDEEMYNFFENGVRDGISSIFKRFATSNCHDNGNFKSDQEPSTLWYTGKYLNII